MLIKLDDGSVNSMIEALRLHAFDDCGGKDLPTHICNIAADMLAALRALPVSDGWEVCLGILAEEIAGIEQSDQEDVKIYLALLYHMQDRMKAALGPLPAPPTIE